MYDIVFEKTKRHGGRVNRTSVYAEAVIRRALLKRCYEKFHRIHKKPSVPEKQDSSAVDFLPILLNLLEHSFCRKAPECF